jgi:hypothetical protein
MAPNLFKYTLTISYLAALNNQKNIIMKKIILSSLFIATALVSTAQSEIYVDHMENGFYLGSVLPADFDSHDFNGETMDLTPASEDEIVIDFFIENNTGSQQEWIISRNRTGVDATWSDYLCWGLTGGVCIDAALMNTDVWVGPSSPSFVATVPDGDVAKAFIHIEPDFTVPGCGLYTYYIGTTNDPYQDSVEINVCFALGIDEQTAPSLLVAPNPASDQITITGTNSGSLQLVNALGQVDFESDFINETTIDVSTFESGMYFAILHAEGVEPVKQKVIIE